MNKRGIKVLGRGRTLDEWKILIKKQKSSGMSVEEWCKEKGIKVNAMWSAQARLAKVQKSEENNLERSPGRVVIRKHGSSQSELIEAETRSGSPAAWVEVKISEKESFTDSSWKKQSNAAGKLAGSSRLSERRTVDHEDNPIGITNPDRYMCRVAKGDTAEYMRVRLKSLEIEISNKYPVEKLMILIEGMVGLC